MQLVNPAAESYADRFSSEEDPLCSELAAYTLTTRPDHAHMLSGAMQGKMLEMVSWMIRPLRILEIGTFTGYSALYLAL